ncbi:MAG: hypothetical protein KDA24_24865, partial [Deltaproteobacteria bacterium]|nr:hypothetical protein [Deltaproteobacteria bacterium]
ALALVAGGVGHLWQPGAGNAALWMAAGFAGVHALCAFALIASEGAVRWAVRGLSVWATASCCFLALFATDTLDWVGL